jgi:CxxC motif-containing protein (DUF1111 family)
MVPRRLIATGFAVAAPALALAASLDAVVGRALFERNWVSAPSSTQADDGLGPLYDAPSCAACHAPRGGASGNGLMPGMVIRLGNAKATGDPVYGSQLQTHGVAGQTPEGNPKLVWRETEDGRVADIALTDLGYGALASETKVSLRRAPALDGAALLARIPETEILKQAAAEKRRGDVAGEPAWVTDNGKRVLGRFGWRAETPTLASQIALAFSRDIGLSTSAHPEAYGECTERESACRAAPQGAKPGEVEVPDALVIAVVKHIETLKPTMPSNAKQAEALFAKTGCAECHATLRLTDGTPVPAYTDLLLHRMGEGLNDGIAEAAAAPGQWRTAPLWNVAESLKMGGLLHDGRARNVAEAILWHGGEAAFARTRFQALSAADKAALAAFVSGL